MHLQPLQMISDAHVGLLWQRLRKSFPTVESQLRLEISEDPFDRPLRPSAPIRLGGNPPNSRRTWFISQDSTKLTQFQDNLFLFNWRKREDAAYPHFEAIWDDFAGAYGELQEMLREENLPPPKPKMVEVSYINWIPDALDLSFLNLSASVVLPEADTSKPEIQTWSARYPIADSTGRGIGRLSVDCKPAGRQAGDEIVLGGQFVLTVRRQVEQEDEMGTLRNTALEARRLIVESFAALTTPAAHQLWGRL